MHVAWWKVTDHQITDSRIQISTWSVDNLTKSQSHTVLRFYFVQYLSVDKIQIDFLVGIILPGVQRRTVNNAFLAIDARLLTYAVRWSILEQTLHVVTAAAVTILHCSSTVDEDRVWVAARCSSISAGVAVRHRRQRCRICSANTQHFHTSKHLSAISLQLELELEWHSVDRITPPRQPMPLILKHCSHYYFMELHGKKYCPCPSVVRIPLKSSWIRILTRSAPKSNGLLLVRHPTPEKKIIRTCRKLYELSAKFAEFPLSHNWKNGLGQGHSKFRYLDYVGSFRKKFIKIWSH